jgi:hypothetical protein
VDEPGQPVGEEQPSGCCPCCGIPVRPGPDRVLHGYAALSHDVWFISLRCTCPGCTAELIATPGNRKRWEEQVPELVAWHRFDGPGGHVGPDAAPDPSGG